MTSESRWLTSDQAAAVLGVRRSTLYAYVSRGVVTRQHDRDHRGHRVSRFDRAAIVALAATRARSRAGTLPVLIESEVSAIQPHGALTFRERPIADLVAAGSFEDIALAVLRSASSWPARPDDWPSPPDAPAGPSARRADHIRAATLAASSHDRDRDDLTAEHCATVAMLAVEAGCEAVTGLPAESGSVAARLAAALAGSTDPTLTRCLDVALMVLIDHELTASTLATRAAAGVRADPWMAILAGQCALSGAAQAGASRRAVEGLRRWLDGIPLALDEPTPGFGHRVYVGPDPRFELLLAEVARLDAGLVRDVERLCLEVARARSLYPNVDLALAALTLAADLDDDSGEVLFTLARTIGLGAHAIEEYPHGLRLRPRAVASQPARQAPHNHRLIPSTFPAGESEVDPRPMDDLDRLAEQYRKFADDEARISSPTLESWARAVAGDVELVAQLSTLPAPKRQPNLVFAALRWHGAEPGDHDALRAGLLGSWTEVSRTIRGRSTQTNEAGRCAILLPLLHRIPGPIALIELGASAGLCLIPDRYSYAYSDGTVVHPPTGPSGVVLECRVTAGRLPPDLASPRIVWRAGLDLNPLDPGDPDTAAWLTTLIWPEHEHRRLRLAGALRMAAAAGPRIERGDIRDLRRHLDHLLGAIPPDATPVVVHSATLAYLPADDRAAAIEALATSGARWISLEARGVATSTAGLPEATSPESLFVAALDGAAVALSNGHGDTISFLEP